MTSRASSAASRAVSPSARLWCAALVLASVFQLLRAAYLDAGIFAAAAIGLVAAEGTGFGSAESSDSTATRERSRVRVILLCSLVACGVVLALPLAMLVHMVALALLAAIAVYAIATEVVRRPLRDAPLRRTEIGWAGLLVLLCLWEVTAFFLAASGPAAATEHPTISALVTPVVESDVGRVAFTAVWLLAGGALLLRRSETD
ncbi:hypothetical protein FBY40_1297 [Microbacterium sp. SLBN-154]|uniref:hypothetical protein n=1 Tax=Microbacterium sp. SLBN-154 TaxID=2768458 RepID=UPI00114F9D2B|nr:hypothetical protein [Microbacterium sp. SLBN-154]TQK18808.1 hypothetical protein FBY40_1297 [Microbacterium sp. SLBN-154]